MSSYGSALDAYHDKRTKDAVRQLKAVLQREPKHDEAALLLGTIYYENDRFKKARSYFERADPESLTDESAFAYGVTYMEFRNYKKAIRGLRYTVKNKGPYREYAIYYLGVIYYKLGQWSRSRRFFQNLDPHELPVYLRVNRRRYLGEIKRQQSRMLDRIIGSKASRGHEQSSPRPSEENEPWRDSDGSDDDLKALPSNKVYTQVGWHGSVRPSLSLTQQGSTLDNFDLATDSVNLFANKESVSGIISYDPPQKGSGLSLQLMSEVGHIAYNARVQQSQYFQIDQATGALTSQESQNKADSAAFAHLQANVSLGLSEAFSLEFGGSSLMHLPDFDNEEAWGQSAVSAGLRVEAEHMEFGVEYSLQQPFDNKAKKDALDQTARTDLEYDFELLRIGLGAYYWSTDKIDFISENRFRYTLVDPSLRYRLGFESEFGGSAALTFNLGESSLLFGVDYFDRENSDSQFVNRISSIDNIETAVDGANKFLVSLNLPLWDAFTVIGSGGYNLLTAHLYTSRDESGNPVKIYMTDVNQMVYQLGGVLAFADWVRLTGTYVSITNDYVHKDAQEYDFKVANPEIINEFTLYLELSKSF